MADAMRALVVDDEKNIRLTLAQILETDGYRAVTAASGEEALELLRDTFFDVLIVDLRLGGRVDGQDLLQKVRWRWPETVVIMLTAYASLESAMAAIQEGVDGYLKKPVSREQLRQAVREAQSRRRRLVGTSVREMPLLQVGLFQADLEKHVVQLGGRPLELTPAEFRLLVYLLQHNEKVLAPAELAQVVQGYTDLNEQEARDIVKWYIYGLRRKVEPDPANPQFLLNVRGVGYLFRAAGTPVSPAADVVEQT